MINISKNPALSTEKLLVYAALGFYLYRQIMAQKEGTLSGDEWMVKVDKEKVLGMAQKHFNLNPIHRGIMEQMFEGLMKGNK
jgi:hypothetical protein